MKIGLMISILVLVFSVGFAPQESLAQTPAVLDGTPGGETGGDGNGGFGDGPVVPLDGGMSLLLLAGGIGYVRKELRAKNNSKQR